MNTEQQPQHSSSTSRTLQGSRLDPYWCGVALWTGPCTETRPHVHTYRPGPGTSITAAHVARLADERARQFVREWNGDAHLQGEDLDLFEREVLRAFIALMHDALGVMADA